LSAALSVKDKIIGSAVWTTDIRFLAVSSKRPYNFKKEQMHGQ